ncbi:MAG: hypothetical protein E7434_08885 [Ruminococcaceae bacterium]|nr:hypothetical protein [Oscillospiraceae bacterium]
MNCDDYISLFSGHLDGVNTTAEEELLQAHINTCEECRVLLSAMKKNDALLKDSKLQPPADLSQRIMQQVRQNPKKTSKKSFYISLTASGLAAAAMISLVAIGAFEPPASKDAALSLASAEHSAIEYAGAAEDALTYTLTEAPAFESSDVKKDISLGKTAVLLLHGDRAQIAIDGEELSFDELEVLLRKSRYSLTGDEDAAYRVSWEDLLKIAEEYGTADLAEKYYSEDGSYSNAVIIFVG